MKSLNDYKGIIFFGGGVLAERLYKQIDNIENKLIAVFDTLDDNRKIKKFREISIQNVDQILPQLKDENNAIVVAVGNINVCEFVKKLLELYSFIEDRLFVVNPYQTLRFTCVDNDLAKDVRIPYDDERYVHVRNLFSDSESLKTFDTLINSKPYEGFEDTYEIVKYNDIKEMYYYLDDYWVTHRFDKSAENKTATVLDCGAFIGDTVLPICEAIPEKEVYYYAIEPSKSNIAAIRNNLKIKDICKEFHIIEFGAGEKNEKQFFYLPADGDPEGGRFTKDPTFSSNVLEIKRIDDMDIDYKGTVYIKMDIEGSEISALKGAVNTITKYNPFLAICVHHRKNDLVDIPLYIKSLGVEYDYYLRGGYHTILLAIPKEASGELR